LLLAVIALAVLRRLLYHVPKQTDGSSKHDRIAFVVLTDPREKHEENVIPMLAHVEEKYGQYAVFEHYLHADEVSTCRMDWPSLLHLYRQGATE
jgi:hypothetical protein